MTTTTDVVQRESFADTYRQRGYFFREAAILTIALGVVMHLLRVIFGDAFALQYVITPTTDRILLVPMTYAAITGIALLVNHRARFANKAPGPVHGFGRLHRGQCAAAHLLQLHHRRHDVGHLVPDVVQLVPTDSRVPGIPHDVLEAAI
jgi:hypothetical protein